MEYLFLEYHPLNLANFLIMIYLVQTLHEGLWLLLAWFVLTQRVEGDSAPLLVDRKSPQLAGNIIPEVVIVPFIF